MTHGLLWLTAITTPTDSSYVCKNAGQSNGRGQAGVALKLQIVRMLNYRHRYQHNNNKLWRQTVIIGAREPDSCSEGPIVSGWTRSLHPALDFNTPPAQRVRQFIPALLQEFTVPAFVYLSSHRISISINSWKSEKLFGQVFIAINTNLRVLYHSALIPGGPELKNRLCRHNLSPRQTSSCQKPE